MCGCGSFDANSGASNLVLCGCVNSGMADVGLW
jgi:hypothetical protein